MAKATTSSITPTILVAHPAHAGALYAALIDLYDLLTLA